MRFFLYLLGFLLSADYGVHTAMAETPAAEAGAAGPNRPANRPDNRALLDMFASLESLRQEISTLRGAVEVQTHNIERLQQKQRELYSDIDRRLQRLEGAAAGGGLNADGLNAAPLEAAPAPAVARPAPAPAIGGEAESQAPAADPQAVPLAAAPGRAESQRPPADPVRARARYQRAFQLLKETQYEQALAAFKQFLADYPDSAYSDNAQYWLAETNYVMQDYAAAIAEYQSLLGAYPDSQKVSHALLKIGYSQAALGQGAAARQTLEKVMALYPGTTVARLADEKLKKTAASAAAGE